MNTHPSREAAVNAHRDHPFFAELVQDWISAGLQPGAMVLLHSQISRTLRRFVRAGLPPDPAIVLDSFLAALGPRGTLLLPLFNFDFAQGMAFDIASTPSRMGALTEAARKRSDGVRTGHPIYSFCALGAGADAFAGIVNVSAFGDDSPFAILHREGGQLAVLDLPDTASMTFMHYVEQCANVPYRLHKTFTASYRDASGKEERRGFSMFVRDLDAGVVTRCDEMGRILWNEGLYKGCRPLEGPGLRTIGADVYYDRIKQVIDSGAARGLLYDLAE
jgi:aminoglycoside 3-N-acetyltransferase